MPTIFCSTKLSKLIGIQTRLPSLSLDNWNGHIFNLEKKKCLVFVHKETIYSFVIFDILKRHLKDLQKMFLEGLLNQLDNDKLLTDDNKNAIINEFGTIEFSTTDDDKSTIGFLNDCVNRLTWERQGKAPTIIQIKEYVSKYYNDNILLSRKATTPNKLMAEKLKNYR